MARGGRRAGSPGVTYGNRTDLQQPVTVVNDQPYGERKRLEDAQKNLPLPQSPGAGPTPAVAPQAPQPAQPQGPVPGALDFARQTERPNEPVTTAPPAMAQAPDIIGAQLRALYQMSPNNDLLRAMELHDRGF